MGLKKMFRSIFLLVTKTQLYEIGDGYISLYINIFKIF